MTIRRLLWALGCLSIACSTGQDDDDPGPGSLGGDEVCDDGVDNDGDLRVDCVDPDCGGIGGCETQEVSCADDEDNDGDALADCADPSCDKVDDCEFGQERTCDDGLDNDGDGKTDCVDASCSGIGGCEHSAEQSCGDHQDNDVDGDMDCEDEDCAQAGICLVSACPTGTELIKAGAPNLPMAVPDLGSATASIQITDQGKIIRVAAGVSVSHSFTGDLDLALTAPGGQGFVLSSGNGSSEKDGYAGTVFSDLGVLPISEATPPYSNAYKPEQSLLSLLGKSPAGTWKLEVDDHSGGDTGSLTEFSIVMCSCPAPCPAEASCTGGSDDDGDGVADCLDPGCDGVAGCEYALEASCGDGKDNDGDGAEDCADPDCANQIACLTSCPAGSTLVTKTATGLPLAIPDTASITSAISVTNSGTVTLAAVEVSIDHTYAADLDISLIAPSGTKTLLSADAGSDGEGYTHTLFADAASKPIIDGQAPFSGPYQPVEPLSKLDGQSAPGTWRLEVVDDAAGDTGQVTLYRLHLCID